MTDKTDTMSGEARLKSRRNRLWRFSAIAMAISAAMGLSIGYASDLFETGELPGWSLYILWGILLAAFIWFTCEYFRRVDELDLMDNLWACLVGFYFYIIATPSWWLFHDLGLAPQIDDFAIYVSTFGASAVAYILRKLGLR